MTGGQGRFNDVPTTGALALQIGSLSLREITWTRDAWSLSPPGSPEAQGNAQNRSMCVLPAATRRSSSGAGLNHISP